MGTRVSGSDLEGLQGVPLAVALFWEAAGSRDWPGSDRVHDICGPKGITHASPEGYLCAK